MKQIFELDPELVAYRTVATMYTQEAFRHGVFRTVLAQSSQSELGWLRAHCDNNLAFADGSRPTHDLKEAIGFLTAAESLPTQLSSGSAEEIIEEFHSAGAVFDQDVSSLELKLGVFGEKPASAEKYIITEALRSGERFLDAHPNAPVRQPVVFREGFHEVIEPFENFIRNARSVRLMYALEYVWAYDRIGSAAQAITSYYRPTAHWKVTNWNDQEQMLHYFAQEHGHIPDLVSYERAKVAQVHVDDISGRRHLDAINSLAVSSQITRLFVDLEKIKTS